MSNTKITAVILIGILLLLTLGACGDEEGVTPTSPLSPSLSSDQLITLGDLDADEPAKKIKRFQPLADYLAEQLKAFGIEGGNMVVARDFDQMAGYLKDGTVDFYFDSAFPALTVQEISGSEIVLRRWKEGEPTYWSTYIAPRESVVVGVEDFIGKVVAFEEPRSTSGFVLPAGALIRQGLTLREVASPESDVGPDEIGYIFSRDEENTVELVLAKKVAGGAISNLDYQELPQELMDQIVNFGRTIEVPRQLVSVRPGLEPQLVEKVQELLVGLDQTDEGRLILEGLKRTKKFDPLPPESEEALREVKALMDLVSGE